MMYKVDNFIPVILESPYNSHYEKDIERNIYYARACCKDCLLRGESPYAPHLLFTQFLDESTDRELGIAAGRVWYNHAAYMVVYDDYGITEGMVHGIYFFKSIKPGVEIKFRKLSL